MLLPSPNDLAQINLTLQQLIQLFRDAAITIFSPYKIGFFESHEGHLAKVTRLPIRTTIILPDVLLAREGQLTFDRYRVHGDGECGYTAFGITRKEAYEIIRKNLNNVRDLLKLVTKEALLNERFINYLQDKKIASGALIKAYRNYQAAAMQGGKMEEAIISELYHQADDLVVINGYIDYDIKDKRIDDGWSHPRVLQVLAHLQNIDLHIWQLDGTNKLIPHNQPEYAVYRPDNATQRIDLLFINNNHFDRLQLCYQPTIGTNNYQSSTSKPPSSHDNHIAQRSYPLEIQKSDKFEFNIIAYRKLTQEILESKISLSEKDAFISALKEINNLIQAKGDTVKLYHKIGKRKLHSMHDTFESRSPYESYAKRKLF
jgi:hypothetical protein